MASEPKTAEYTLQSTERSTVNFHTREFCFTYYKTLNPKKQRYLICSQNHPTERIKIRAMASEPKTTNRIHFMNYRESNFELPHMNSASSITKSETLNPREQREEENAIDLLPKSPNITQ